LDGTIYRGDSPIPYAREFIEYLNENDRKYLLLTNCPGNTPGLLVEKLSRMGISVREDNILTSGQATASYLEKNYKGERVYLVGGEALEEELRKKGIDVTRELRGDGCDCVVVGYDKQFTYEKMTVASQLIAGGARFICTNGDLTIPHGETFVPHTGAISLSIEAASGVKPIVVGKPEKAMLDTAMELLGCRREDCCIIGDNLDTDISMGTRFNIQSFLVLTGVTNRDMAGQSVIRPSMIFENLLEVLRYESGDPRCGKCMS